MLRAFLPSALRSFSFFHLHAAAFPFCSIGIHPACRWGAMLCARSSSSRVQPVPDSDLGLLPLCSPLLFFSCDLFGLGMASVPGGPRTALPQLALPGFTAWERTFRSTLPAFQACSRAQEPLSVDISAQAANCRADEETQSSSSAWPRWGSHCFWSSVPSGRCSLAFCSAARFGFASWTQSSSRCYRGALLCFKTTSRSKEQGVTCWLCAGGSKARGGAALSITAALPAPQPGQLGVPGASLCGASAPRFDAMAAWHSEEGGSS